MYRITVGTGLCLLASSILVAGADYDAASAFSTNSNPNGVWSYGYSTNLGGAFTPHTLRGLLPEKIEYWRTGLYGDVPGIFHNPGAGNVTNSTGTVVLGPNQLALHPGTAQYSVLRFIAPEAGTYRLQGAFVGADRTGTTTDAHVLAKGAVILNLAVTGFGPASAKPFDTLVLLGAGDVVEFAMGAGGNGFMYDSTGVSALISRTTDANDPVIASQPHSQSVIAGDNAAFSVGATGPGTLSYQWRLNGDTLPGATTSALSLTNIQPDQAGSYSAVVANAAGSVTSDSATLTVTTPSCAPPPPGLASWWQGEGSPLDSLGAHNGTVKGDVAYVAGKTGQAFRFNGSNSAVDLGGWFNYQTFTLSMWVNPGGTQVTHANILDTFHNERSNWVLQQNGSVRNQYYFAVPLGGTAAYSTFSLSSNQWQHVVITRDTSNHNRVYVNGALVAEAQDAGPINYTNQSFRVGAHASNVRFWNGQLDELAVFDRALTVEEIGSIYAARGAGLCSPPPTILAITPPNAHVNEGQAVSFTVSATGVLPLTYQWQHEGQDLQDATNATLLLNNLVYTQAGTYTVVVAGPGGTASSNAVLQINRAPIASLGSTERLLISPNGLDAVAVLDGAQSSDPDGDTLTYAWIRAGEATPFATSAVAVETLPLGTNHLTLVVSDGMAQGRQDFEIEVITTSQAVDRLAELAQSGADKAQPLLASLRAALAAIDRSQPETAINQLEAFKNKVLAQVAPADPALANQLLADAQAIIDALNGSGDAPAVAVQITGLSRGNNGKSQLKIRGTPGRVLIIETSTDAVHWEKVGVARGCGASDYEFEDSQTASGVQFYRVVSPK